MSSHPSIWRRRWARWVPALVLSALNLGLLVFYFAYLAGSAGPRATRISRLTEEVARLTERQGALDATLQRAESNRRRVGEMYAARLGSEAERLTKVISEVRKLARQAGIEPRAVGYPKESLAEFGLVRQSMVFNVTGSYMALRQFVNLLELSDEFLILEEVRVVDAGSGGQNVRLDLRVSTLFQRGDEEMSTASVGGG